MTTIGGEMKANGLTVTELENKILNSFPPMTLFKVQTRATELRLNDDEYKAFMVAYINGFQDWVYEG